MNLGFFSQVDIDTSEGTAPDRTVLTVEVSEVSTGELSFGAGLSSAEGVLGDIAIRERNLLGRGQELRLALTVSESRQEIDLSFTEPYFMDRDVAAGVDVFQRTIDLQDESSFDRETVGFVTRAGYPLAERLRQTVSYTLKNDKVSDVSSSTSRFIAAQEGETITSAVAHRLEYDLRDSRIDPTDGYVVRFGQEIAGLGGDAQFLKHTLTYGHFYSVADGWVLSAIARAGHIFGIDDDVRIVDRFFLGGRRLRASSRVASALAMPKPAMRSAAICSIRCRASWAFHSAFQMRSTCGARSSWMWAPLPRSTNQGRSFWTKARLGSPSAWGSISARRWVRSGSTSRGL